MLLSYNGSRLENISKSGFLQALNFIYTDMCHFETLILSVLYELLNFAETFQLKRLAIKCQNDFLRRINAETVIEILKLCAQNSNSLQATMESAIWYLVTHPNDFDNNKLQQLSSIPLLFPRIFRELVQLTIDEPHPIPVPEQTLSSDILQLLDVILFISNGSNGIKSNEVSDINIDVVDRDKVELMNGHRCSCIIPAQAITSKILGNEIPVTMLTFSCA
jgi:hypothetical protein